MKSGNKLIITYFLSKNLKLLLMLGIFVAFFILQFYFFRQHTQAFYFGDESEHLVPGWMMAKYGKKLYIDISTNHQPIPIFVSYVFIKTVHFENLFMLVERARQLMFVFSFFAALFFVILFGFIGLVAVVLVEIIKFYFLGYHFLAESLVVYPIMIITGLILKNYFEHNKTIINKKRLDLENILFGFLVFFSAFSLLVLLPFLTICTFVYLFHQKRRSKIITLLAIFMPTYMLFSLINVKAWFVETIYYVLKYFIPYESQTSTFTGKVSILLYPFKSFLHLDSIVSRYIAILMLFALFSSIILIRKKKSAAFVLLFMYMMLVSLNLRIPKIDVAFYEAFHILPFVGGLTLTTLFFVKYAFSELKYRSYKYYSLIVLFLIAALLFSSTKWWREKTDKNTDHYVQYSELETVSYVLSKLKLQGDTLWVSPLDGMVNIISDIPLADRQNAHLPWAYRSPVLRNEFQNMIQHNPPTFILFYNPNDEYYLYMQPYLENEYTNFVKKDGKPTSLYIINSRISKRSSKQWKDAQDRDFIIPEKVN